MPSFRSIYMAVGLTAVTLLQLSSASPVPVDLAGGCPAPDPPTPTATPKPAPSPVTVVAGDATALPSTNLTLLYVSIGRGIQNYTCASVGAAPVAVGAVATLFDVTKLADSNQAIVDQIPPKAVYMPLPPAAFSMQDKGPFSVLGHHYFNAAGSPVFDLMASAKKFFVGKKLGDIKAPATADKGPAGTGAVDYLQLGDKGGSVGISIVYRVVTAGGAAPATCPSTSLISVQYAAEYWFYG